MFLPGRPLTEMVAALKSYDRAIRGKSDLPVRTKHVKKRAATSQRKAVVAKPASSQKLERLREAQATQRKLREEGKALAREERKSVRQEATLRRWLSHAEVPTGTYWEPEEFEHLCEKFIDRRFRPVGIGWDAGTTRSAEYQIHFSEPLPYDHPDLPDWLDGVLPNLAARVIVIREVASRQVDFRDPSVRLPSSRNAAFEPITCSSRIPPKMSIRELLQDYAYLRAYSRTDKMIALTCETYLDGKPEMPAKRFLITCGGHRRTIAEKVRDRYWLDAVSGQVQPAPKASQESLPAPWIPVPRVPAPRMIVPRVPVPAVPPTIVAPPASLPVAPVSLSFVENDGSGKPLKPREAKCLEMLAKGKTNKQIADAVGTTEQTVKNILGRLYVRMGVRTRNEARVVCLATDLLETGLLRGVLRDSLPSAPSLLTPRLRSILSLVLEGKKNQEIADALGTSLQTVKNKLFRAYDILGVTKRADARRICAASGMFVTGTLVC